VSLQEEFGDYISPRDYELIEIDAFSRSCGALQFPLIFLIVVFKIRLGSSCTWTEASVRDDKADKTSLIITINKRTNNYVPLGLVRKTENLITYDRKGIVSSHYLHFLYFIYTFFNNNQHKNIIIII
jgi:hypothetical protein